MKIFLGAMRAFVDLKLNKKITCIILAVNLLLLCLVVLIGLTFFSKQVNALLYQTTESALSYAEKDLVESLTEIEQISRLIVVNATIQENLQLWANSEVDGIDRSTAYSNIVIEMQTYQAQTSALKISNTSLWSSTGTEINVYSVALGTLPADEISFMIDAAIEGAGTAVWLNDAENNCAYLVRSIRCASPLTLETLGVLVLCVDLDRLIESQMNYSATYGETYYLLATDQQVLYASETLGEDVVQALLSEVSDGYQIFEEDGAFYFAVSRTLASYGWEYTTIVPYTNIYNSLRNAMIMFMLAVVCAIVLSSVLSSQFTRQVVQHMHQLIAQMDNFDASKTIAPPSIDIQTRKDEIGQLHRQFYHMTEQILQYIEREYKQNLLMKDAQLRALEAQIDPHFLYNVLASVTWRAKAIGEKQIPKMLEALSRLLRASLQNTEENFTLGQELALMQDYMTIQQIRFEEDIVFTSDIPSGLELVKLPKLTIQPLLENAIQYGMKEGDAPCHIKLWIECDEQLVKIFVRNTGSTFPEQFNEQLAAQTLQTHGLGIALFNIQQRIQLAFGEAYGLSAYNTDETAVICITIPRIS